MPSAEHTRLLRPRFDLGLRSCRPRWKQLSGRHDLSGEIRQGLLLAGSTLPLSIFLASLAGAPASSGILSAAIGSAACVLVGGTRYALSGPGLTSALVSSSIVARHGLDGLASVLVLAGLLQLLTGALGFGRFVRFVPQSVLRGCVMGIAIIILLGQLPHAFGVTLDEKASVLARLDAVAAHLPQLEPGVLATSVLSILLGVLALRLPQFPGAFVALVLCTLGAYLLGLELPSVHEASSFPLPRLPRVPWSSIAQHLGSALELWGTMTLATALNTLALERLDADAGRAAAGDPDQELIGNALATIALAFLHGLPATQLVARSALGLRLGVSSVRPSLIQALVVLVVGLSLWPFLHLVPLTALSGIAIVTAVPLLDSRPLRELGHVSPLELGIAGATIAAMVFADMATGILLGLASAFAVVAIRMARTRALVHRSRDPRAPHQVNFSGPITFLAALELEQLRSVLARLEPDYGLVVDLRNVVALDGNGALALVEVLDHWRARGGRVALLGPSQAVSEKLLRADETRRALPPGIAAGALKEAMARTDRELDTILGKPVVRPARPQLLAGITRFREEMRGHYDALFGQLADGQHPHTMFITCADSRIDPALLIGSHPGDLFTVRAIGALVAPAGSEAMPQEGAAVEYGVGVLGVRTIVVCGHSKCGAIAALKKAHVPAELETLGVWAKHAEQVAGEVASFATADDAARAVTVRQLENLMSYPLVRAQHARGELQLHAWFYDLGKVELFEWDAARKTFVELSAEPAFASNPPQPMTEEAAVAPEHGARPAEAE